MPALRTRVFDVRARGVGQSAAARRHAAAAVVAVLAAILPRAATGDVACDAGAECPDEDHDGFALCGCALSGTPCDCDDSDPTVFPGAPERCDSTKDSNCSGAAPDRCPMRTGCLDGMCVPQCIPLDDFGCATGSVFAQAPDGGACLCKQGDCSIFGCPAGETCDDSKTCVPSCSPGVRCPPGQICRGFGCVDPCAEVTCPAGSVCAAGRCRPSCACQGHGCRAGETCDLSAPVPACAQAACVGVRCPVGQRCEGGGCVDQCAGVVCPPMKVCRKVSVNGDAPQPKCVELCTPTPCEPSFACQWRTGECVPRPFPEAGLEAQLGATEPLEVAGAGWVCAATVARASSGAAMASALALSVFAARRWRRRRR